MSEKNLPDGPDTNLPGSLLNLDRYVPETVSVDKQELADILEICIENTNELLANHLSSFGETTTKNKLTANLYRGEIDRCKRMKAMHFTSYP